MNWYQWLGFMGSSMLIGALIGGSTNLLAICMLFRPWNAWKVGRWQLPFTPGLIPKRRDEIADSIGRVVKEHLFTAEGLQRLLEEGEIQERMKGDLKRLWQRWVEDERSLGERLNQAVQRGYLPALLAEPHWWRENFKKGLLAGWQASPDTTLFGWLGPHGTAKLLEQVDPLSRYAIQQLQEYVRTPAAKVHLTHILSEAIEGLGRGGNHWWLGAIKGFLDEEKIATWLLPRLAEGLQHPRSQQWLSQFLADQFQKLGSRPLNQLWDEIHQERVRELLQEMVTRMLPVEQWWQKRVQEILPQHAQGEQVAEWLADTAVRLVRTQIPKVMEYLSISEVVSRQVKAFPLRQLEQLILEVAYRELRLITLLGALIGGLVGLVQGLWMQLFL